MPVPPFACCFVVYLFYNTSYTSVAFFPSFYSCTKKETETAVYTQQFRFPQLQIIFYKKRRTLLSYQMSRQAVYKERLQLAHDQRS